METEEIIQIYYLSNVTYIKSMDSIEKAKKLGSVADLKIDKFTIKVVILNFKKAWGNDRWLVKPVAGSGEVWVENVIFTDEDVMAGRDEFDPYKD